MTDYKQLCAEFVGAVGRLLGQGESPANPGQRLILTVHVEDLGALADRARAALAEPEPEGPADINLLETLREMIIAFSPRHPEALGLSAHEYEVELELRKVRAVLARWGNHPESPDSSAQPS